MPVFLSSIMFPLSCSVSLHHYVPSLLQYFSPPLCSLSPAVFLSTIMFPLSCSVSLLHYVPSLLQCFSPPLCSLSPAVFLSTIMFPLSCSVSLHHYVPSLLQFFSPPLFSLSPAVFLSTIMFPLSCSFSLHHYVPSFLQCFSPPLCSLSPAVFLSTIMFPLSCSVSLLHCFSPPLCSPLSCSGPIPLSASSVHSEISTFSFQDKRREQKDFSIPGSTTIPRAVSYEDFRRHRDLMLSSGKKVESSAGGSSIRKAKSESDVAVVSLRKRVDVSDPLPTGLGISWYELCVESIIDPLPDGTC